MNKTTLAYLLQHCIIIFLPMPFHKTFLEKWKKPFDEPPQETQRDDRQFTKKEEKCLGRW